MQRKFIPESAEDDGTDPDPTNQTLEYHIGLIKPDAIRLNLVGEILHRYEKRGLQLCYLRWFEFSDEQVTDFYADKRDAIFWEPLKVFLMSGPLVAMIWQGVDANARGRQILGQKRPLDSPPGSIRGGLPAQNRIECLAHGSRTSEEAMEEILLVCPGFLEGMAESVPAADRPEGDAPYAEGELAYHPERDGWEGKTLAGAGVALEKSLLRPWDAPEEVPVW